MSTPIGSVCIPLPLHDAPCVPDESYQESVPFRDASASLIYRGTAQTSLPADSIPGADARVYRHCNASSNAACATLRRSERLDGRDAPSRRSARAGGGRFENLCTAFERRQLLVLYQYVAMSSIWEQMRSLLFGASGSYADAADTPQGLAFEQRLVARHGNTLPPWPLFKLGAVYGVGPVPPNMRALLDGSFFLISACLGTAALFDFAGIIGRRGGGVTAAEVAKECNCADVNAVGRVLRACENWGYFESYVPRDCDSKSVSNEQRLWRNTLLSALLREDHPQSVRAQIMHLYVDIFPASALLFETIRDTPSNDVETDGLRAHADASASKQPSAFERVHQCTFWEYLSSHPDRWDVFNRAMRSSDALLGSTIMKDIDWGRYLRVIDLGAADGSLVYHLLSAFALKAVIFDLPPVIEHAKAYWNTSPERSAMVASGRVQFAAGDLFDATTVPAAEEGDIYVMRNIWHDWRDPDCIRIGRGVRAAIGDVRNVKLVILEASIDQYPRGSLLERFRVALDQIMFTAFRSKERDRIEFDALLRRCGFQLTEVRHLRASLVAVIAEPLSHWVQSPEPADQ